MFQLFRRRPPATPPPTTPAAARPALPKGLTQPEPPATLLATPRRQRLLEHIWQRTSVSREQFGRLYLGPIEQYAALVQTFPASESHHHAYPGGMLDHGLEIVACALKLRQSHLLPVGGTPETQSAQAEAWNAGIAYAALLHDIGKVAVDLDVELADGSPWRPWQGPMQQPFRFRYRPDREYRLHSAATGLLYARLLEPHILDWLCGFPDLWPPLLYVLAGQYEHAGMLGELVIQADQASVAMALGGDPAKALAAPKHALQRKLLEGLRYLLKQEFKLNQPQASDGWLTQDALWLVSKTVSDKLRAHLLSQGFDGIPANNTTVFNVLQEHGIVLPTLDGKAIWKATVTSDAGWTSTFTFMKLSPALIWEADERPAPFAGTVQVEADVSNPHEDVATAPPTPAQGITVPVPSQPAAPPSPLLAAAPVDGVDALLTLLAPTINSGVETANASHNAAMSPTPTERKHDPSPLAPLPASSPVLPTAHASSEPISGEDFIAWLRDSLQGRRLILNDAKALVHTVDGTVYLVSPGIFQRYAQAHPQVARLAKEAKQSDWEWVQKRFEQLRLHRKQDNGLNIWTCEVTGPRKSRRVHGYLLKEPAGVLEEVRFNNPYLKVLESPSKTASQNSD